MHPMIRNHQSKSIAGRKLKVRSKHFSRSFRRTVVYPEILLCGKWLEQLGFVCGQTVLVQHQQNQLIITVISNTIP